MFHPDFHILTTFVCLIAVCFTVQAQNTEPAHQDTMHQYQVDEVVITGTRTYRKIIDVPYSVERIDQTQYKFERKTSVDNVLGMIPGLFFQNRYGNHDVRISIRGFGSRSNTGIRGVRILLDGIPESEPDGQTRIEAIDFHSVGAIEVVKGNASSLYTNAPGGVINFINDITFPRSFLVNFNEFSSYDTRNNGIKAGIKTDTYRFLLTYNYHQARGYRPHSEDYWHIVNSVLESNPGDKSTLNIYTYFVDGLIRLPGSLTRAQFDADPFQANRRDVARDAKRISTKGRIGVQLRSFLDDEKEHEVEVTGYATMKYFERTARTYRVLNRNGVGTSGRYVHHSWLFGQKNEFTVGGDIFYQTGPIEEYENINGKRGDRLVGLTDERIGNVGFYLQNSLTVIENTMDVLLTGRYDKVAFDSRNQILQAGNALRRFEAFTPKAAVNYKLTPTIAIYGSFGLSFDSPAGNELGNFPTSSKPTQLLNPDLKPQKSQNGEIGIKGNVLQQDSDLFRISHFELTLFSSIIDDEIIPFEVFGDVFFRNAARTNRKGVEVGGTTEILRGLTFKAAYTFSDFTYDRYRAASQEIDDEGNVVTIERSFAGNRVPSVPQHNFAVTLSYERPIATDIVGFVKTGYRNISGMYVDDFNSERSRGYHLLDGSAGCDVSLGQWSLLFHAGCSNIADRTHAAFININSTNKEFYEAGERRTVFAGLNLGYRLQ